MAKPTEQRLRERMERVEALFRGATTPGERKAAFEAAQRLLRRMDELRSQDPVAQFCRQRFESLGVPGPDLHDHGEVPDSDEVRDALKLWHMGEWSDARLARWASRVVDRVVLPTEVDAEGACRGEVLLALAAMHRVRLTSEDVPAIFAFLAQRDWAAWFALLEHAARRSRVRRKRVA